MPRVTRSAICYVILARYLPANPRELLRQFLSRLRGTTTPDEPERHSRTIT